MVRKQSIIFLGLLASLLFLGCATIITGKKQSLYIVSTPAGATIQAARVVMNKVPLDAQNDDSSAPVAFNLVVKIVPDSTITGVTPCFIHVKRPMKDNLQLTLTYPGFQPATQILKPRFNEAAGLNFIIPWNWMIDAMSNGLMRYSLPDTFVLKEIKKTQ